MCYNVAAKCSVKTAFGATADAKNNLAYLVLAEDTVWKVEIDIDNTKISVKSQHALGDIFDYMRTAPDAAFRVGDVITTFHG